MTDIAIRKLSAMDRMKESFMLHFPLAYERVKWLYNRCFTEYGRLVDRFVRQNGLRVNAGPFAGMEYLHTAYCSRLLPKLVGSYEEELHPCINTAIRRRFGLVVDIGCAEGYYAVGLARACESTRVIAFDLSPYARSLCRQLARKNGVANRMALEGACTPESLSAVLDEGALVISDCEGYERELLDLDAIPALRTCTLIVELHDLFDSTISRTVARRFADSHNVTIIPGSTRDADRYPSLSAFNTEEKVIALSERPKSDNPAEFEKWAFMVPRVTGSTVVTSSSGA